MLLHSLPLVRASEVARGKSNNFAAYWPLWHCCCAHNREDLQRRKTLWVNHNFLDQGKFHLWGWKLREKSNPFACVGTDQTIPTAQTSAPCTLLGPFSTVQTTNSEGVPYNREDGCFVDRAQYLMAVTHHSGACHDMSRWAVSSYCHSVTTTWPWSAWESSG